MLYGLYLSAQGAHTQSTRLDVISNNLANAGTTAFKRDLAVFQAHPPFDVEQGREAEVPPELENHTGGVSLAGVVTDFSDGPLTTTGGAYDLAVRGPGFFRVGDGRQEFLTRNGAFAVDDAGQLVTQSDGHRVLSTRGAPVVIPPTASDVEITTDGRVFQLVHTPEGIARSEVGQIDLVLPESPAELQKVGHNLYRTTGQVAPANGAASIQQGFLEASGTSPVFEMMDLISTSRAFEANVNMIQYQNETLGQLLQSMVRR